MAKTFLLLPLLAVLFAYAIAPASAMAPEAASAAPAPQYQAPQYPTKLIIPSLSLSNSVIPLGTNSKGEMDVPDGNTSGVGWYKFGTIPGEIGSAVFDAHVFAAFAKLKNLKVGDSIYVVSNAGKKLHFVVTDTRTYALADVPADMLFNRADTARLNLITCTGSLTRNRSTYDHRLVIYTKLVDDSA